METLTEAVAFQLGRDKCYTRIRRSRGVSGEWVVCVEPPTRPPRGTVRTGESPRFSIYGLGLRRLRKTQLGADETDLEDSETECFGWVSREEEAYTRSPRPGQQFSRRKQIIKVEWMAYKWKIAQLAADLTHSSTGAIFKKWCSIF
ncbi:hypothetical protein SAY86_020982 [Trapa natans]|uniref:Uncharacterized protein n=1 Tax=Trapa natans TaxID=22666 RepID=A0AAN7RFB5_TRANT|nr:hypothetical protein SAY86_020982 [Trapa natans]